jgi:DNA-binding transcriptional ArsR family regulator
MSLAAVSKHVKVLEQAGLLEREIKGRNHLCRINTAALKDASRWISGFEPAWQEGLDRLVNSDRKQLVE